MESVLLEGIIENSNGDVSLEEKEGICTNVVAIASEIKF